MIPDTDIPATLRALSDLIDEREIQAGSVLLEQHLPEFDGLKPGTPEIGLAARLLAEWREVGFDDRGALDRIVSQFTPKDFSRLPLSDYIQLRLATASLAFAREEITAALSHLDFVLAYGQDTGDRRAMSLANLWKARCLRKAGEYDSSLEFAQRARALASEIPLPARAAVIQLSESWVLFQKGSSKEATRVLGEAEAALRHTDDYITLGNIQSAYGRIARREGRYEQAIQYFERSLALFRHRPMIEGHFARSLTNIAKTRRLLALEMRRRMDSDHERRQKLPAETTTATLHKGKDLERLRQLLAEARAELQEADEIFRQFPSHHGSGNVQVGLSEIALDLGHLDEAERAALRAFELGSTKQDYLLVCRARIAQASIANARYEEQVGEAEESSRFAQLAYDCSREAVAFAEHTQSRRIIARAYIWQGLVLMNGFFNNPNQAQACAGKAEELLSLDRHGALWEDLQMLQSKILRRSKLDPNLRAWSQGIVGDKTLQQVVEEFEAMLVSRVWEREARKVSRVAQRLSVSPKKVRRLLRRLGLLSAEADEETTSPQEANGD